MAFLEDGYRSDGGKSEKREKNDIAGIPGSIGESGIEVHNFAAASHRGGCILVRSWSSIQPRRMLLQVERVGHKTVPLVGVPHLSSVPLSGRPNNEEGLNPVRWAFSSGRWHKNGIQPA